MTRVMHILAPSPVGGLERVVQSLACAQQADERLGDVHVVTMSQAPVRALASFIDPLRDAGVRVHTVVTPPRAYARQREELRALVEQLTPDIVHTHGTHADVLGLRLGESTGAATVSTLHGVVGGDLKNRVYEWLQRRSCRQRDAVVAVSRPLAAALLHQGFAPERTHVVRNTWRSGTTSLTRTAARQALGLPAQGFIVGWVGRISHEKGLDVLIDALGLFPTLDVHLAVIGDGSERATLQRSSARSLMVHQGRLHWVGMRPGADALLTAFDVVVLSSRTEGTPMLLFEAMSAGVPVIAAAVGGIPDVIGPNEALLVPAENPRALWSAVDAVHRDATGARGRADAAARRLLLEHDVARWSTSYASVYDAARQTAAQRRSLRFSRTAAVTSATSTTNARRDVPASRVLSAP